MMKLLALSAVCIVTEMQHCVCLPECQLWLSALGRDVGQSVYLTLRKLTKDAQREFALKELGQPIVLFIVPPFCCCTAAVILKIILKTCDVS